VAPRLEHDVISTDPRRDRVTLALWRYAVPPGPHPWSVAFVEYHQARFRASSRHQSIDELKRSGAVGFLNADRRLSQPLGAVKY
jgi:hypothetical protein